MNNKITFAEIQKQYNEGTVDNTSKEFRGQAIQQITGTVKTLTAVKKAYEESLEKSLAPGEQISFDFGDNDCLAELKDTDKLGFDIPNADLLSIARKCASGLIKSEFNETEAKKLYKKGTLPAELAEHVVVTRQTAMKISSKKRKEDE